MYTIVMTPEAYEAEMASRLEDTIAQLEAVKHKVVPSDDLLLVLLEGYCNPVDLDEPHELLEWVWEIATWVPWGQA